MIRSPIALLCLLIFSPCRPTPASHPLPERVPPASALPTGESSADSTVASNLVAAHVRENAAQPSQCFAEHGLRANTALSGSVTLAFTLDSAARVNHVEVLRSTWNGPEGPTVERCIVARAQRWQFPREAAGDPRAHQFTFTFR
jgi:outer membrane biosynthesis protein TonB